MKKLIMSAVMCVALMASAGVMAQDGKTTQKECCKAKTECKKDCKKECCKKDCDKKCTKDQKATCPKDSKKACCDTDKKADKK